MRLRLGLLITVILSALMTPPTATAVSTLPSAPTSVTATAISGGVRATWSAPTDISSGVTGYKIEWSTTGLPGSWTQAGTVSGSTFTYDVLGLSQVATYIRVSATSSGGYGPAGYPWTKIYGTTSSKNNSGDGSINYESTFGIGAGNASNTYAASNFTRVRYRMDATINGTTDYAETDFYTWPMTPTTATTARSVSATVANLQIPVSVNSSQGFVIQANVSDLNVYSSNSRVTNSGGLSGRLEIWPWNYELAASGLSPAGVLSKYDFDDYPTVGNTAATAGNYGSFQVHDLTNSKTVFAWNYHAYTNLNDPDVGFGNNPNANGHPDWTFCHFNDATNGSCPSISSFRLQIYINIPVTPLIAISTTAISLPNTGAKGTAVTITAISNLDGFYLFTANGKRIAGCLKKATSGSGPYTATCSWRPTNVGYKSVAAIFSNTSAGYIGSQAVSTIFISKRTTLR